MNDDFLIDDTLLDPDDEDNQFLFDQDPALPTSKAVNPINKWDPRLILDLAVGVDPVESILARYGLTRDAYERLLESRLFKRELAVMIRDVQENGASFKAKARIQAESYLPILDAMVDDQTVAASVRLQAIRDVVRWGELEPKKDVVKDEGPAQQVLVQINF